MPRSYRYIISLGSTCRSAHHIRRHFGISEAYPFDWWILPLTGTVAFLEDPDLDKLYDERLLAPLAEKGSIVSVRNEHYGIQLFHEFPRENGVVIDAFAAHADVPKERTRMLLERFFSLPKDAPILFVKGSGLHDPTRPWKWRSSVARICRVLKRRYGFREFDVLLVNPPMTRSWGRVRTANFVDVGPDWRGDATAWTAALTAHATYAPPDAGSRPAERPRVIGSESRDEGWTGTYEQLGGAGQSRPR